ncbi:MAG: helix-turn-helix domain-containing protein [Zoogloeaceae bacterium]|jgi:transposase InsO family protein|nr:helix-turn-helix domain-containing protein [Zoogloeaceae bacterium]
MGDTFPLMMEEKKWLKRYDGEPAESSRDRPRRPLRSPRKTPAAVEEAVRSIRQAHPAWDGRKITHVLERDRQLRVAPSTVTHILHRRAGRSRRQRSGEALETTRLAVWRIRLGIRLTYSRPPHPQTNGKDERFHRTFKADVPAQRHFETLTQA